MVEYFKERYVGETLMFGLLALCADRLDHLINFVDNFGLHLFNLIVSEHFKVDGRDGFVIYFELLKSLLVFFFNFPVANLEQKQLNNMVSFWICFLYHGRHINR
jgi:hypothetical protein